MEQQMDQEKDLSTSNKKDVENGDGSNGAEDEELCSFSNAIELAFSVVLPMVMEAAVELQVLDIIAKAGPRTQLSPSQLLLFSATPTHQKCWIGCYASWPATLTCSAVDFHSDDHHDSPSTAAAALEDKRLYGLTPLAKYFVPNQDGVSLGPLTCLVQDNVRMKTWFNEVLNNAMVNYSTIFLKKFLQSSYNGVEHVGGNMFESVPKGDAIFMKGVLHDWNDDLCLKLLKNCYKALPDNGKIIAAEGILPEMPDSARKGIFLMDLQMMTPRWRARAHATGAFGPSH
ncbi:hypothetical protein RHSIM_Rhsim04G0105200 [Rhododendron simsii]|uniref:O-methyltransferase C-terminal domain-containing protein n=1 Tax=Rhododendron simsii TaxID=118357 RepID=A0A834LML1_RHOSS|nr:hypothetical protein RHSIM_Rhsim04G0105200 [Rhododendron simsii]